MVHLTPITQPRVVQNNRYLQKREYNHEATNRSAQFYGDTELRMGFLVSKLSIFERETNITQNHPISNYKFFSIPKCYNPWSYDGDIICLTTINSNNLDSNIQFYSFTKKKFLYSRVGNSIALLCSPSYPRVLMDEYDQKSHSSNPYVVDLGGKRICDIPIRSIPNNLFISWLEREMEFIAITKDPLDTENNWLYHGDGRRGKIIDKIPLNPQELVPYKKEDIIDVPENVIPIIASTSHAYGSSLNEWNQFHFDAKNDILSLTYYHPIGEIIEDELLGPSTSIIEFERKYKIEI